MFTVLLDQRAYFYITNNSLTLHFCVYITLLASFYPSFLCVFVHKRIILSFIEKKKEKEREDIQHEKFVDIKGPIMSPLRWLLHYTKHDPW